MAWPELLVNFLGGLVGGSAAAGIVARVFLSYQMTKKLEIYKFLLTNRARACGAILQSMGRVISVTGESAVKGAEVRAKRAVEVRLMPGVFENEPVGAKDVRHHEGQLVAIEALCAELRPTED